MRLIIPLFLYVVLTSFLCKKPGNRDFRILQAEQQTIFGGVAGSPVVTVYRVVLLTKRKMTFTPDTGWAEGKADAIILELDSFRTAEKKVCQKKDTVRLYFEIRTESNLGGGDYQLHVPGSRETQPPEKGEAGSIWIRYAGGKDKLLNISNLIKRDTIMAP